ncbi:hypothetical protein [Flavilitoribacter nigricans]|uniref:Uncharacterized protein n=1 Tax=Flavilitoribacter nigricans (strain ATCC 23147 / DSM 23189 / NBRC 102662 / NCIMB 1420 / SS-2) TaxID=1122177 RepID=A0A2D0NJ85_FLAN2|nr:hypothetical protein [Flavilitoribacter nigricans]PHN07813.1 hypothetical protein CRP01_04640 [Flavilitoribacter nigricans DSM 23189 = NBRC 102662]
MRNYVVQMEVNPFKLSAVQTVGVDSMGGLQTIFLLLPHVFRLEQIFRFAAPKLEEGVITPKKQEKKEKPASTSKGLPAAEDENETTGGDKNAKTGPDNPHK